MPAHVATLRLAALPKVDLRVDALVVTLGAALIAASAQISIALPFTPVPITGQTFAVLLVGASLGTVRGASSALLYVLIGIAGAPVYADGAHGWAQITGASGGYLVGFILAAAVTGRLAEQRWDRRFSSALGAILTGNVIIFLIGLPWLAIVLNTSLEKTLEYGLYPFIPGEILKLYLAAILLPTAWRLVSKADGRTERSDATSRHTLVTVGHQETQTHSAEMTKRKTLPGRKRNSLGARSSTGRRR